MPASTAPQITPGLNQKTAPSTRRRATGNPKRSSRSESRSARGMRCGRRRPGGCWSQPRNHNSCKRFQLRPKQQALDQKLPDEAGARCAERGPRRHFLNLVPGSARSRLARGTRPQRVPSADGAKQHPQRTAVEPSTARLRHNGQGSIALLPVAQCRTAAARRRRSLRPPSLATPQA